MRGWFEQLVHAVRLGFALALAGVGCKNAASAKNIDGKFLFASSCARCHGVEGGGGAPSGSGIAPRNFHDATFQAERTDAQLKAAMVSGKNNAMPAFGATFNDAQLNALVSVVRSFDPRRRGTR